MAKPQRFCKNGHDKDLPGGKRKDGGCSVCRAAKAAAWYHTAVGAASRRRASAAYRARNPEKIREQSARYEQRRKRVQVLAKFGLTEEDFAKILRAQGFACAICRTPDVAQSRAMDVDHDHVTGEVRGALCRLCNTGIGALGDDPQRLANASAYLASPPAKLVL